MNRISILNLPLPISIPLISNWKVGVKIFWILSFILITALLIFYIFQVNAMISENYLSKSYERKLNEIVKDSKNLEINFSQVNSLKNIETLAKDLNFEKVDKIHYIQVLEGQVVTK